MSTDATMFLAVFIAFLQFQRTRMYSKSPADAKETEEKCRYVVVRGEDSRENLTSICYKAQRFEIIQEKLSYTGAVETCLKSNASLQVVETFGLSIALSVNRRDWIKDYNLTNIINSLRPGAKVTGICIGIVMLDRDSFEFVTTFCDENHTVICDATGVHTALTLTTRDEMMSTLGDLKARIASNQQHPRDFLPISLGLTLWVLPVAVAIIAIVKYRKRKLNQNLLYSSKYPQGRSLEQRRQTRETLSGDNCMRPDIESEGKALPHNYLIFKGRLEREGNKPSNINDDEGYVFPIRENHDSHEYQSIYGK